MPAAPLRRWVDGMKKRGERGRRGREERIENMRDRAADIVNGRKRSQNLENKIVEKFKYSDSIAFIHHFVTPASSHPSVTRLRIILYFVFSWLVNFLSAYLFGLPSFRIFPVAKFSSSSFSPLHHPSSPFYKSSTLVADQLQYEAI